MNISYAKDFNKEDLKNYTEFMHQKGIKDIPRFNKNKIENFIKEKRETKFSEVQQNKENQDYINGLKLEFRSLKIKLLYPDIYFTLKKLENENYSIIDYFLDLCLSK